MDPKLRQLAQKVINKDEWWDILYRFIEVLKINIFIVDNQGIIILPSEEGRYGGRLLSDSSLGFDMLQGLVDISEKFISYGKYLETSNKYNLTSFAIPVKIFEDIVIAYVIVGPVILNKRLQQENYESLAKESGVNPQELWNEISGLRVISNVMVNSILDLLNEIIRNYTKLSEKRIESEMHKKEAEVSSQRLKSMVDVEKEIYSTVRLDELLISFLDIALKMAGAESGSIMVMDEEKKQLIIKVSKGLSENKIRESKLKEKEGIADIALKERSNFFIDSDTSDNRIKHLLKRPEIKQALVMPLTVKNRPFGVLNISAKNQDNRIKENFENLQYLSNLLSSAV